MIYPKSQAHYAAKIFSTVFLLVFLLACKKDITQIKKETPREVSDSPDSPDVSPPTSNPASCYDYIPLTPQPGGTLTGYYYDCPVRISNVAYQAYDSYGNPIAVQQGDPFIGNIDVNGTYPAVVTYDGANGTPR